MILLLNYFVQFKLLLILAYTSDSVSMLTTPQTRGDIGPTLPFFPRVLPLLIIPTLLVFHSQIPSQLHFTISSLNKRWQHELK
jgi:hypothetical protein